jgi:hypothetical protein
MVNKQKQKGDRWERELAKLLNKKLLNPSSEFKKTPSSGALGTIVGEPSLTGDVRGRIYGVPRKIKIEAKVGYGGSKQMTFYKEWLDKIAEEAAQDYSIPIVACRFSNARQGVENFVAMDLEVFIDFMNLITILQEALVEAYE